MKNSKNLCLFGRLRSFQRLFFIALFSVLTVGVSAQSKTVSGTVNDAMGPVIGASVLVKGTTNGVITDIDGNFTLQDVPANGTIQVSFVGYKTQDISVAGKSSINVKLQEDTEMLDEVVVVGYGVQKKSDVTGALTRVGAEELNVKPVANAFEALQGKAAGVDITSNQRPGEVGEIRIRGNRSLNAKNTPLYVVDGVPLNSGGIETINPRDIESVDILKDASSTAIYGSRGANGVILITTKRGKTGALSLNYSGSVTFENLVEKAPAMSASDYITWRRWAYYNSNPSKNPLGNEPDYDKDQSYFSGDKWALANVNKGWDNGTWDASKVTDTDWTDMVTQTGITHEHTLSATGGTESLQGAFSFGYLNNEGTQKGQEYERYNVSMSVDIQAKPWFKMGGSINASYAVQNYGYSRTGQTGTSTGPVDLYSAAKAIPRYTVPYDEDGEIINQPGGTEVGVYTIIDEWKKSTDERQTYRALGSFYAQLDFGKMWEPLEGLSYKFAFGPDFRYYRKGIFIDSSSAARKGGSNYANWANERHFSWTLDNMITYNKKLGDHNIGVTLLQSASKYNKENGNMSETNVLIPGAKWNNMGLIDITNSEKYAAGMGTGLTEQQLASYMARVNYSYKDRYLLTVSGRYDGSSVLAKGNKWDFFPSAALGWRIDQEDFLKDVSWINQLKLRFGMGTTGNAAVDPYGTLSPIGAYYMPFSTGNTMIFVTNEPYYVDMSKNGNILSQDNLSWEKTTQFNYGIDFSVLQGRIGGTIDIYHSRTTDLLMKMNLPSLSGYPSIMSNVGETKNFGVDFSLNLVPIRTRNFEWNSDINLSYQKDKIVELSNGKQDDISNSWFIGQSIGVYYGIAANGLWQEADADIMKKYNDNGHKFQVGMVRPVDQPDENGEIDYKIDDQDRVILGNKNPRWVLGWSNTFSYKGFDLSIELYGRFKYMVSTGGEGQLGMTQQREISYWTPDNTNADYQKPIYNKSGGDSYSSLLGFKEASFLKLRNISLGYNFDKKLCKSIGLQSLKVYAQGKNLGDIYSSIDFLDLDLGTTSYYNRGFTFGVQVGF